jgi:hypothetical protein
VERATVLTLLARIRDLLVAHEHPYAPVLGEITSQQTELSNLALADKTKGLFGGMGSLNDVWLVDATANRRLDDFRDKLWDEVDSDD